MEIKTYGAEILNKKAVEVTEITDDLKKIIEEMIIECPKANGIGLAAPQIGMSKRFFVVTMLDHENEQGDMVKGFKEAFINPEITEKKGSIKMEEGCLSVPGIYEIVERPEEITINYTDINGVNKTLDADGMLARVILHEYDHLDGILFISKIPQMKKDLIRKKLRNMKKKND
ncbi:MAG: peptide deformylase [Candidatus Delongbacteria bacterium]|nr:peptide deformylase [Candidatus Delongbacteria bacterium]